MPGPSRRFSKSSRYEGCPNPLSVISKFGTPVWLLVIYPPIQVISKLPCIITVALSVCPVAKRVPADTLFKLTTATLLKRRDWL